MKKSTWVIFDAMGVIYPVKDDIKDLFLPFAKSKTGNPKLDTEKIMNIYINKASRGKMLSTEFVLESGLTGNIVALEEEYLDTCLKIDPTFSECAASLKKKGYKIGMLSNDIKEWSIHLRKKFKIEKFFDLALTSGDCGCRKPDREIFECFLKKSGAEPEECMFIDDNENNLATAAELGFHCIRFSAEPAETSFEQAASFDALKELLQKQAAL